jgi:hypothetical protein
MCWKIRYRRRSTADIVQEVIRKVANNDPLITAVVLKDIPLQPDVLSSLAMALISNTHMKVLNLSSANIHSDDALLLASALAHNKYLFNRSFGS